MGCSGRVKAGDIRPEQKWDFISLNDFHSTSCFEFLAYGYLWVSLLISLAVYGVDTFTAVNLLAFDKWSSSVQPVVDFKVQKWVFAGCIIASWVNLGFEHVRAMHVMKRGAVAENYLDSLAVRLQCIRLGKGRGWRRFLVFSELTKSKKGAEYVALFTFFSFQTWIRIIFCQGPRQVLNALTLWAVVKSFDSTAGNAGSTILKFFENVEKLADENHLQAVVYSGMLFTLVIWAFGALCLLLSALFYILFLWHYIPNADGGLSGYCERKVNRRLASIVSVKVNKALEKEDRKLQKLDAEAAKKGEMGRRQATLPTLLDHKSSDGFPAMPTLYRQDTATTLPVYASRPGTPASQPPFPDLAAGRFDQMRPTPSRMGTHSSSGSNAPLMSHASDMGYARSGSPAPSLPPLDAAGYPAPPQRSMTANSNASHWNRGPPGSPRMPSAMGARGYAASPVSYENTSAVGNGPRMDAYGRPLPRAIDNLRSQTPLGPAPSMGRRSPFDQGSIHGSQGPQDSLGGFAPPNSAPYQSYDSSVRSASPGPGTPSYPGNNQQQPYRTASPGPGAPNYPNRQPQPYYNVTDGRSASPGPGTPSYPGHNPQQPYRTASPAPGAPNYPGRNMQ
ncbi:uncharacterized protein L3040_001411 [Drepanopeziza brunnea f. sp. 'multigermtubi']|uniref:Pheromone-regulated membrane protein n=1 Tax=Marssonina brunnea f. sp. multigermtubi (strain MB_m1) TaxID=1072389 RepID=K1WW50_MARBU|nr:pheromone-regulated membrane protein [Drepanopeziza brunnea f. sp. 'multigermtubi' MB_m1]EKD16672.1 pheromone-regulated membrane protein [Drepanopeziza brunnea f. sp. 'multigermtubi' MB_m1]KAJ5051636.1 hypothetical protein L3040_001411 [Drepanopeziza brunnea f. sp. 'multigermtubi']